jgi:hypothetical protein
MVEQTKGIQAAAVNLPPHLDTQPMQYDIHL